MRLGLAAATVVAATLLTAPPARADGWYFVEGFGGASIEDRLGDQLEGGPVLRLAVGRRIDRWAVEGYLQAGFFEQRATGYLQEALTYGLDVKYLMPVTHHVEVYVRGGLNRLELQSTYHSPELLERAGGRGLTYGAGVQVSGKVPVLGFLWFPLFFTDLGPRITGALWLDTSQQIVRVHDHQARRSFDGRLPSLTVGFALGNDF